MNDDLKTKALKGSVWTILEKISSNIVSFIVSMILARILAPEEFGKVALLMVFISICDIFVESGLGIALIQKKNVTEIDFSTIFYFNNFISVLLYAIVYITAPYIAMFYNDITLTLVFRILGLMIIVSGLNNVQQAYVSKTMQFKRFFFSNFSGTLFSGIIGIILAIKGLGIWAIVIQQLLNRIINTIVLWFTVKWRPKLLFSFKSLRMLFSFGINLLLKSLLENIFMNVYALIIGKSISTSELAYYNRGQQFPNTISSSIEYPIQKVMLPTFSIMQDDCKELRKTYKQTIRIIMFFVCPILIGLAATGKSIIIILLTEKWISAYPYLVLWCLCYLLRPILIESQHIINARGKSGILLKAEILQKVIGIILLFLCINFGPIFIMLSYLLYTIISCYINMMLVSYEIDMPIKYQLRSFCYIIIISSIMGMCVFSLSYFGFNVYIEFTLQVFVGIVVYIGLMMIADKKNIVLIFNKIRYIKK